MNTTNTTLISVEDQNASYLCELAAARIRGQHATIQRLLLILERRSCTAGLAAAETIARAAIEAERHARGK